MALFQKSVLKRYVFNLAGNKEVIKAYDLFTSYFHNPTIQENIRAAKEEQFQEGFLRELFVKVLGYTLNPEPSFNLTTEYKNVKDAKKADAAIIIDGKAVAVIELKSTSTPNLDTIEVQAFGYKNNQPEAVYVITSNFEKLRFYVDNAINHVEFNLFDLSLEQFALLYMCLHVDNIKQNLPKKVKDDSLLVEEDVTKKLYKDYTAFKNELFTDIVKQNPELDKLLLFKKTQKLIDRFLFVFFAEDRLLIAPNTIRKVVNQWTDLRDKFDAYVPLYDRFKKYFVYLNEGYKSADEEIFGYNGGLFAPDELLDNLKIKDELLYIHTQKLSAYDFESEVDVNILGHIFENSLNEIEEITAQLEGKPLEKTKTKRKKDGVFYTPKYITKYIVDNTVGKLCSEKKAELGIIEEDFVNEANKTQKKALLAKLELYRAWLKDITICDPACGSGAFLNQALDFLIQEHHNLDKLQTSLLGGTIVFPDVTNDILERNLYGVDINDESIEIAKLSLWLRTAQKGRKLTVLSNNIKCGNSLIDNPEIAAEKAFIWEQEFPEVFAKGGFDVVIGNPPYVQLQKLKEVSHALENGTFSTFNSMGDLYCLFYEKGYQVLKINGILGYITSSKWLRAAYGTSLRDYLLENTKPHYLIELGAGIFSSATVDSNIWIGTKNKSNEPFKYSLFSDGVNINLNYSKHFIDNFRPQKGVFWIFKSKIEQDIEQKIKAEGKPLRDWDITIYRGVLTGLNEAFIVDTALKDKLITEDPKSAELLSPLLRGRDIERYYPNFSDNWLITTFPSKKIDIELYPAIKKHLASFGKKIEQTGEAGARKKTTNQWFETQDAIAYHDLFNEDLLIWKRIGSIIKFCYGSYFTLDSTCLISSKYNKYLLCVLNSKLGNYLLRDSPKTGTGDLLISVQAIEKIELPIPKAETLQLFEKYADTIIDLYKQNNLIESKANAYIRAKLPNFKELHLKDWDSLSSSEFLKLISIPKMNFIDESNWLEYFESIKVQLKQLKSNISNIESAINNHVYQLYSLDDEEIQFVETNYKLTK